MSDDEFTELYDADIPRLDVVGKGANGRPFLLAKADGQTGLFSPDQIRDLLKTSPGGHMTDTTIDPAGEVEKADLDVTEPLADDPIEAPGSPDEPGSPAWEATDAATARKWTAVLSRAKNALAVLGDREMQEAVTGADPTGDMTAWDLDDAASAIDYAISILAPYAADEQAEADISAELEQIGKAAAAVSIDQLEAIEALTGVAKAGRVLSAVNEARIRDASDSLQSVLSTLPAPIDDVVKADGPPASDKPENDVSEDVEPAAKADVEGMVPMYNDKGTLVGVVAPDNIVPLATSSDGSGDSTEDADADGDTVADPAAAATADGDPAGADGQTTTTAADDLTPAPSASVGEPTDGDDVKKNDFDTLIRKAVGEALDAQAAEHAAVVKGLKDDLEVMKGQIEDLGKPAKTRVLSDGARPAAHLLRGQDNGANADVSKESAAELKAAIEKAATPAEKEALQNLLQNASLAEMNRLGIGGSPQ